MSTFLESLMTEKQRILSTLDPDVFTKLQHIETLIGFETTSNTSEDSNNPPGGDRPPTTPPVG